MDKTKNTAITFSKLRNIILLLIYVNVCQYSAGPLRAVLTRIALHTSLVIIEKKFRNAPLHDLRKWWNVIIYGTSSHPTFSGFFSGHVEEKILSYETMTSSPFLDRWGREELMRVELRNYVRRFSNLHPLRSKEFYDYCLNYNCLWDKLDLSGHKFMTKIWTLPKISTCKV